MPSQALRRVGGAIGLLLSLALMTAVLGCVSTGGSRVDPERRARSHYNLAIEHLRKDRPALAIRELRAAEAIQPDDPWIHVSLAEAYRRKGLAVEAETHLVRALAIDPAMQPALLNVSALYVQLDRYEEALAPAQRLLDDPTFPVPWKALANMGWAQYQLGRHAEARHSLENALDYHPDFWPAILSLAVMDAEQDRRLEAMQRFERVIQLGPGPLAEAEANYRLAEVYISLGNRAKAVHHLTAASTARPGGEWGRRSQDYLKRLR